MNEKDRKEVICPVCKRRFRQPRRDRVYCCDGCSETAIRIKKLKRWVVKYTDEILDTDDKEETA